MYKIIGGDNNVYGPVSADELRQWIREGRANGQTLVQGEGDTEWKALASLPEFTVNLAAGPVASLPFAPAADHATLSGDILQREYDVDIGLCLSRSWDLLKNNFGVVVGGTAIYLLIQFALNGLAQIPIIGILATLGTLFIFGPLMGGVYYFLLKNIRRQPVDVGDVFSGFKVRFVQLMLTHLVQAFAGLLAACPGAILLALGIVPMIRHQEADSGHIVLAAIGAVIALIPLMYLSVCWVFALPLVMDKGLEFWPAMETSRKIVVKHWWTMLALMIVGGLIVGVSALLCCLPMFVGTPLYLGAMMYAYEDIFGHRPPTP